MSYPISCMNLSMAASRAPVARSLRSSSIARVTSDSRRVERRHKTQRRPVAMPPNSRAIALPYAEQFAAVADSLPGHDIPWLRELRRDAVARFTRLGLPSPRVEQWKYTNLNALAVVPFEKTAP